MSDVEMPAPPLGDPETLRTAATRIRVLRSHLADLAEYVKGTALRLYGQAWRGKASVAFLEHCDHIQWILRQCGDNADAYADACNQWADALEAARAKFMDSEALSDQAGELRSSGDPAETPEQAQRRLEGATNVGLAAIELRLAAIRDAEAAARDAAGRFAAIASPAFGAMTDGLFDPNGRLARLAGGVDGASDAMWGANRSVQQMFITDAERLRFASRLGDTATLVKWTRILGPVGDLVGAVGAGLEQYAEDLHNPLLRDQDRLIRALEDGVVRGTTAATAGDVGGGIGAGIGFVVGGPIGAGVGTLIGDAVFSEIGDRAAESELDQARGEAGVPAEESVLQRGNRVVDPPEEPPRPKPRGYPSNLPGPDSESSMGIRRDHTPTPPQQENARQDAQRWADMQQALQEGVRAPEPAPAVHTQP